MQYGNRTKHSPMQIVEARIHVGEIDYMTGVLHAIGRVDLADRLVDLRIMEREFDEANSRWRQESGASDATGFQELLDYKRPESINQQLEALMAFKKKTMRQIKAVLGMD